MPKTASTYLILIALYINSFAMFSFAYRNFIEGHGGIGILFLVLFVLLISLAGWGTARIGKMKTEK